MEGEYGEKSVQPLGGPRTTQDIYYHIYYARGGVVNYVVDGEEKEGSGISGRSGMYRNQDMVEIIETGIVE